MNRTRSRLLRFLIALGPASCADAAVALELSKSTIRRQMALLCGAGIVRRGEGTYSAQPDQIEKQLRELSSTFQSPVPDFRDPATETAYLSLSQFHSSDCPHTSKEIN
ncbi:ArsR/SmtB family transcription factor [Arthrobacter sp. C152]